MSGYGLRLVDVYEVATLFRAAALEDGGYPIYDNRGGGACGVITIVGDVGLVEVGGGGGGRRGAQASASWVKKILIMGT